MEAKISRATFVATYIGLIVLLVITAAAAWFPLGAGNTVIAFGVAVLKALLIVVFFMELRVATPLLRLAAAAGIVWLVILFGLSLSDYFQRGAVGVPGK